MLVDEACFERGCACHDSRESPGVEVVRKEWVGLTDEEIWETPTLSEFARAIEAKLKEKNT